MAVPELAKVRHRHAPMGYGTLRIRSATLKCLPCGAVGKRVQQRNAIEWILDPEWKSGQRDRAQPPARYDRVPPARSSREAERPAERCS